MKSALCFLLKESGRQQKSAARSVTASQLQGSWFGPELSLPLHGFPPKNKQAGGLTTPMCMHGDGLANSCLMPSDPGIDSGSSIKWLWRMK